MNIIDLHCDALLKLWEGKGKLSYSTSIELEANKLRLKEGKIKVQCFALFVYPDIKSDQKFQCVLEQIQYFYEEVLAKNPDIKHIKNWSDFDNLKDGDIGAFLSLEGVDCIGNDLTKLAILRQLGVLSVGLTWNNANLAADGAGEPRGAGLTLFGKEVIQFNNEHQMLTDVSHLSERAYWDVLEYAKYPIASHSNSRRLCDHQRNLTDNQASAMFDKGGMIHVVYCPPFIKIDGAATILDLVRHIDHFCSIGGVNHIGFGSDFDGISTFVVGLEHAGKTQNLINELLKHFTEEQVKGFAYQNFMNYRQRNLAEA